jgi:hypothetical protein
MVIFRKILQQCGHVALVMDIVAINWLCIAMRCALVVIATFAMILLCCNNYYILQQKVHPW